MDNRPIGVFDSGVGGLTVASELIKRLPEEQIIYFGDTARVPYGTKSKDIVTRFSSQIIRFLLSKNVKAIVIACNTVSSNCMAELKQMFDVPIIGVVEPGVNACIKATKNNRVGVIGTKATVSSGAYDRELKKINKDIEVFSKACTLFVPLVEEDWTDNDVAKQTIKIYLSDVLNKDIDTILLGCTHYPLLKDTIQKVVGEGIRVVNPASETAKFVEKYLDENNLRNDKKQRDNLFFVSDECSTFDVISSKVLRDKCLAEKIDIEKY